MIREARRKADSAHRRLAMDLGPLLQELSSASLFDLNRLSTAVGRLLHDSDKIDKVKARLQPGMTISYLDDASSRFVEARVLQLNRVRVLVENVHDLQQWNIPYSWVNLEGVAVALPPGPGKLAWNVGDSVGFKDRQNRDMYGTIISLNPKTATILVKNNGKWRVAYGHLFEVLPGTSADDGARAQLTGKTLRVIEACEPDED
jgi:hypothetical protein